MSIADSFSREAWVKANQKNAMQQSGVWGGPTVFVCFSGGFGQVTRYTAELTSVAKYILQPSEVVEARLAMAKR
jgi:hypothetical protein